MDPSAAGFEPSPLLEPFALARDPDHAEPPSIDLADDLDDADRSDAAASRHTGGGALDSLDDEALARLVARVMRQDEAALAQLYEQLSGRVYAVALRITRQVACAEEVLQDTFWQVWRQAPRFDPRRGSAVAWVMLMARSRALDAIRSRSRDPTQSSQQLLDDDEATTDDGAADPMDLLLAVRRDGALHAQLAKLDPLRRQLIALAFFRGMTHDEIAEHTGLPLGTVKSHFRRTLMALQAALGPDFVTDLAGGAR